jgi:hypothetical protein
LMVGIRMLVRAESPRDPEGIAPLGCRRNHNATGECAYRTVCLRSAAMLSATGSFPGQAIAERLSTS